MSLEIFDGSRGLITCTCKQTEHRCFNLDLIETSQPNLISFYVNSQALECGRVMIRCCVAFEVRSRAYSVCLIRTCKHPPVFSTTSTTESTQFLAMDYNVDNCVPPMDT